MVKIDLKYAVSAVQWAVQVHVDDEVVASQVMGCTGTGLDKFPSLLRQQQPAFPPSDRIGRGAGGFQKSFQVMDDLNRYTGEPLANLFRHCVIKTSGIEK